MNSLFRPHLLPFLCVAALSSCVSQSPPAAPVPAHFVEAGEVTPHGVWTVKKALSKAGIAAYADGSHYPQPYHMMVAPENKVRAAEIIAGMKGKPQHAGF